MNIADHISEQYKKAPEGSAIIICGPTASGKSRVALELCEKLSGEIVSCDSMQIYRMMDIGTAKPSPAEQAAVPHHMIDIIDPWNNYSAFMYKEGALDAIRNIVSRGKVPVVCGGTGLYVNTLIDNRIFADEPEGSFFSKEFESEKEKCDAFFAAGDKDSLHSMLLKYDPEAASSVHKNNIKRVYRQLSLYFTTGRTRIERNRESLAFPQDINFLTYCLMPNREELCLKIDCRVDVMREMGLFEEADFVYGTCRKNVPLSALENRGILKLTALSAIGYRELIPLLDYPELSSLREETGIMSLDAAFDRIKRNTRQYAKRQVTWFRKTPGAVFIQL